MSRKYSNPADERQPTAETRKREANPAAIAAAARKPVQNALTANSPVQRDYQHF
jgi:hypothetical protein